MMKKMLIPKTFILSLGAIFILCSFNYVCYAESGEDAMTNKGFWKEIWSRVTSHEGVKINKKRNTVPIKKIPAAEQKEADRDKHLKMIKSRLDTYPEIFEKMPNLSALRTPGTESVYFYKTPDGKIFYLSELDANTLKYLWKRIERSLNW